MEVRKGYELVNALIFCKNKQGIIQPPRYYFQKISYVDHLFSALYEFSKDVVEVIVNVASRIPSLKQLAPVYSVIVVAVYGFSMVRFFWRVPSLINYSTVGQVAVIFSYTAVVNLLESLIILLAPIVLSMILPGKWFFDQFIAKGVLLVSLGLGYFGYISSHINTEEDFPYLLVKWSPLVFIAILALVFPLSRIKLLARLLEWIAEQLEVFLLISLPVSAIALVVVLIRNIF